MYRRRACCLSSLAHSPRFKCCKLQPNHSLLRMIRNLLHFNRLICRSPKSYSNCELDRLAKDVITWLEWICRINRLRFLRIYLTSTVREVECINILLASFPLSVDSYSSPIVISLSRIYTCAILCCNLNLQCDVSTVSIVVGSVAEVQATSCCGRSIALSLAVPIIVAAFAASVLGVVAYSTA